MTKTYVRSGTSPEALEVRPSVPASDLHPDMVIEVPNDWVVTYFAQESRLLLKPSVEVQA